MFELSKILMEGDRAKLVITALLVFCGIVLLVLFLLFIKFFRLWIQAYSAGASVKMSELIGMWLR
jgi:uncharacterized protein YqfA (UPF0365 family)